VRRPDLALDRLPDLGAESHCEPELGDDEERPDQKTTAPRARRSAGDTGIPPRTQLGRERSTATARVIIGIPTK